MKSKIEISFATRLRLAATALAIVVLTTACGVNIFQKQERKDPAEDATVALEKHDEDGAIGILEDALLDDPANPKYLSILSLAYAQRAGVEPLQFAKRMAALNSGSGSGSAATDSTGESAPAVTGPGDYTSMFSVMPSASEKHLSDLDEAVDILTNRLPQDLYQPGDDFKLALYQTASVILHTKALDTNGDGKLSLDEILNLSTANATDILAQIAGAQTALGGGASDDATKQAAADTIAQFQSQIDASPGATPDEKLKNYLAQSGAATSDAASAAAAAQAAGRGSGSGSVPVLP